MDIDEELQGVEEDFEYEDEDAYEQLPGDEDEDEQLPEDEEYDVYEGVQPDDDVTGYLS